METDLSPAELETLLRAEIARLRAAVISRDRELAWYRHKLIEALYPHKGMNLHDCHTDHPCQ